MTSMETEHTALVDVDRQRAGRNRAAAALGLLAVLTLLGSWNARWGQEGHRLADLSGGVTAVMMAGVVLAYALLGAACGAPARWRRMLGNAGLAVLAPTAAITSYLPNTADLGGDQGAGPGTALALLALGLLAVAFLFVRTSLVVDTTAGPREVD